MSSTVLVTSIDVPAQTKFVVSHKTKLSVFISVHNATQK